MQALRLFIMFVFGSVNFFHSWFFVLSLLLCFYPLIHQSSVSALLVLCFQPTEASAVLAQHSFQQICNLKKKIKFLETSVKTSHIYTITPNNRSRFNVARQNRKTITAAWKHFSLRESRRMRNPAVLFSLKTCDLQSRFHKTALHWQCHEAQ